MSFRAITLRQEELPWSWPLRLGSQVPARRARCVITAQDEEGRQHQAELAPCAGVHSESLNEALSQWRHDIETLLRQPWSLETWNWTRPAFGLLDLPRQTFRSVLTAVEQLLLSWAQQENPEKYSLPSTVSIEGSALLALQNDADVCWQEFLQLWDQGFRIFKCKVGRLSASYEYDFLREMSKHGASHLRLDANRGMSPEAVAFWKAHSHHLPIAYWEEAAGMEPLALDETLWDSAEAPTAAAWILKPSRLGLSRTVELLKKASVQHIPCVLSNAFDSGMSLRCSAWVYAAFCTNPQPLGYGTTRFLPPDMWQSEKWGQARVTVPRHPFAQEGEA
jgi:L-alanine-DL-glutamate epimerase-like enolase superfamily enzyme